MWGTVCAHASMLCATHSLSCADDVCGLRVSKGCGCRCWARNRSVTHEQHHIRMRLPDLLPSFKYAIMIAAGDSVLGKFVSAEKQAARAHSLRWLEFKLAHCVAVCKRFKEQQQGSSRSRSGAMLWQRAYSAT